MRLILALMLSLIVLSLVDGATEATVTSKAISANDVRARIVAGQPAEFDNCIIVGDLNLSALNIEGPVHFNLTLFLNSANFSSTTFNGPAYFAVSMFNSSAHFRSSEFNGPAGLGFSTFNGPVDFKDSKFNKGVNFLNASFNSVADFTGSKFNVVAYFKGSKFNDNVGFTLSNFNGQANFMGSEFNNYAVFAGSNFYSDAYFDESVFRSDVEFSQSKFDKGVRFWFTNFNSSALFRDSSFNDTAYFEYSTFNGTAVFSDSEFNSSADFSRSHFNRVADFSESKFNKDAYFLGAYLQRLDLSAADYEKIFIRWDHISSLIYDDDFGDTTYQLLIENFKKLGFLSDADNCYYEFRKNQCLHRDLFHDLPMFLLDFSGWVFYGYGKKPLYPLGWSVGFILAFGIFWYIAGMREQKNTIDEYSSVWDQTFDEKYLKQSLWSRIHSILKPILFSATIFLSGTKLFVDPPEVPISSRWSRQFAFNFERALGAFFFILLFLAIGATIVR